MNDKRIRLCQQESASLHDLTVLALDSADSGWSPSDGPKPELAQFVVDLLVSKADMLADYFSLQISKVGFPHRMKFQFHFAVGFCVRSSHCLSDRRDECSVVQARLVAVDIYMFTLSVNALNIPLPADNSHLLLFLDLLPSQSECLFTFLSILLFLELTNMTNLLYL